MHSSVSEVYLTVLRHCALTLSVPIPDKEKISWIFFSNFFVVPQTFYDGLKKAFLKFFEAPQRTVEIKIEVNFLF